MVDQGVAEFGFVLIAVFVSSHFAVIFLYHVNISLFLWFPFITSFSPFMSPNPLNPLKSTSQKDRRRNAVVLHTLPTSAKPRWSPEVLCPWEGLLA